jgi:hypothetical protein
MNFQDYLNKRTNSSLPENGKYFGNGYQHEYKDDGYEEVDMVLGDLKKINDLSYKLYDMIKKGDCDLEDWLQIKISQAADRLSTSHDYLKYKE